MNAIPYSPKKVDLYYPARRAKFFATGLPDTEAGLCAEMTRLAYCRTEPYFQFDQEQIATVLTRLGFTCQFFESTGTPGGVGTHAFLALHDDPDPERKLAVVAFRGTDAADPIDLTDDAEFLQCEWAQGGFVHRGFAQALAHVLPALKPAVDKVQGRVLFAGHSLGAALATLLAGVRRPDYLYTFGSPRVGDAAFVATLTGINSRRFVDCCDIVTRVPPESLPSGIKYAHHGVPYYIDRHRLITENLDDVFIGKDRLAGTAEYLLEYAWRIGNVGVRNLADHATINYVTAVSADVSQPKLAKWRLAAGAAAVQTDAKLVSPLELPPSALTKSGLDIPPINSKDPADVACLQKKIEFIKIQSGAGPVKLTVHCQCGKNFDVEYLNYQSILGSQVKCCQCGREKVITEIKPEDVRLRDSGLQVA